MISFNALYLKCEKNAGDINNRQFFKDAINEGSKVTENELDNFIVEDTRTGNTIAGLNQIPTPENYLRAKFLYVLNGQQRYDADFVYSENAWQTIVSFQNISSNFLTKALPRPDFIELFPIPSSILPYTLQYVSQYSDMQYDDISTGSIVSITNTIPTSALPYATVVGSGTSWLPYMAGMYFQMAGDKQWYKITSVTDTTHLVLKKAYAGIPIAGFLTQGYVIGQMPRLPEAIHMILYYYALKEYYAGPKKDAGQYKKWSDLYDKWLAWGKGTFASRTEQGVIPSQRGLRRFKTRNPNLFPTGISGH